MALLMLPRVVLTHLKAGFRAALRPDLVMIGWWTQPALPTPVKQCRPSLTTVLAGWKLRCAKVAIAVMVDQRESFVGDDLFELISGRPGAGDIRRAGFRRNMVSPVPTQGGIVDREFSRGSLDRCA